ncbi:MAG: thiol:disulfide interchange protein DsbA/DsbL [Chromatocurvus sp.]
MSTVVLALVVAANVATSAFAQDTWKAGEDYDVISPAIRTSESDKVEVHEFFWYGCGHCYNFEPLVVQWKKTLPEDVVVKGSPAIWNKPMELHAQAFYTAEVLGVLDDVHLPLFQALNVDGKRLQSEKEIGTLFEKHGVDREEFSKAFNSFGVGSMTRQANARARAAKITGTPEMMVNGKYRITTRKAGSQANMLKIANFLIEKERSALTVSSAGS